MSEQRKKTVQYNFRLPPELANSFDEACEDRGITKTQFFENAIRCFLGEPPILPELAESSLVKRIAAIEARLEALESKNN